ncbi:MAG TPA: hypothetical protein DIT13_02870 [Verrucomicrobiales bacterium]|nr:hypothetical protein [Verrucomicrobiales bacterium]HRJ08054.1 DUF1552 domain-containing protein [Prosthecobacter sp.]HRK14512.1 DUF1552 domain-containing protein [Prosthecobacter sp.]
MNSSMLNRRRFLNRLSLCAGAPVLAPLLDRVLLGAEGGKPPLRFLFVVEGNSVPPKQLCPAGIPFVEREQRNAFTEHSLLDAELPTALKPVAAYRDRLTVIQGLSGRMCSGGHSSDHGALGAYHANHGRNLQAATVDCVIGQAHPGIHENLVLGISSDADKVVDFNCSASGRGRSRATLLHPSVAYTQLFGAVAKGEAGAAFQARRHLLDHMRGDIRRARSALGSLEKEKMDAYLSSFETLGTTSQRLVEARDRIAKVDPGMTDKYSSQVETDRLDAHFELATAALIGGMTNCATIASGVGFPNFNITFTGLGIQTGKHPIGHALYNEDDTTGWDQSQKIRAFHFQLIARTMDKLKTMPEGGGTMLDNTVIVYLSDGAETHHSRCFEWPFVVLGNASGRLKAGRYLQFPDYGLKGHRTINALHETLLHLAGASQGLFGSLDPNLDKDMHRGPLDPLLA